MARMSMSSKSTVFSARIVASYSVNTRPTNASCSVGMAASRRGGCARNVAASYPSFLAAEMIDCTAPAENSSLAACSLVCLAAPVAFPPSTRDLIFCMSLSEESSS